MTVFEPKVVPKPWGYERIIAHTDRYVAKIIHIKHGHRLSRQHHETKDETIFVLRGRLIVEIGAGVSVETIEVAEGFSLHIPPGTIHRFIAPQHEDCELVESSTPELLDVVRHEDDYGREGTNEP